MSSSYGQNYRFTIFGQSHSAAVGVAIEGIPAGERIDREALQRFMDRRAPGRSELATARKEADVPEFVSGLKDGVTCGAPLAVLLRNTDARSADYAPFAHTPRPGHADFTAAVKYRGHQDAAGGGHFSGRLTAPLCVAGGIALQLLQREGIRVFARLQAVGGVWDTCELTEPVSEKNFPVVDEEAGRWMRERILMARSEGDSVGGVVECRVDGLPAGLGDPIFDGMENRIAAAVFGIPAVKGLEFGEGFRLAEMSGSEANDPFILEGERVSTRSNNCGGILGGITDGMPLVFRAAFKPTPSISVPQDTVDLEKRCETAITVSGRHDPCVALRAVPVVEAAAAAAVYDALLEERKNRRMEWN